MITQLPRLESRVGAQEHMTIILHARIQELSDDMIPSFKQLLGYLGKIEDRFDKVEGDVAEIKTTMVTKEGIAAVRANMATKEDITAIKGDMQVIERRMDQLPALGDRIERRIDAFEERMLESFKQVLVMLDTRLPPAQ